MKIKYYSDDDHEFETKHMCEKYEEALEKINEINGLPKKVVDGKQWYRISSVAEFYFFDHMDDNSGKKSNRDMYKISQIVSNINHYFPYWITKDFEEGVMIDKKRVEVIDESITFLEEEIQNLKSEKKELEKLRTEDVTDDDYEMVMDVNTDNDKETDNTNNKSKNINNDKQSLLGTDKYNGEKLDIDGLEFEMTDVITMAKNESGLNNLEWNEISQQERNSYIEQQIKTLKNV